MQLVQDIIKHVYTLYWRVLNSTVDDIIGSFEPLRPYCGVRDPYGDNVIVAW